MPDIDRRRRSDGTNRGFNPVVDNLANTVTAPTSDIYSGLNTGNLTHKGYDPGIMSKVGNFLPGLVGLKDIDYPFFRQDIIIENGVAKLASTNQTLDKGKAEDNASLGTFAVTRINDILKANGLYGKQNFSMKGENAISIGGASGRHDGKSSGKLGKGLFVGGGSIDGQVDFNNGASHTNLNNMQEFGKALDQFISATLKQGVDYKGGRYSTGVTDVKLPDWSQTGARIQTALGSVDNTNPIARAVLNAAAVAATGYGLSQIGTTAGGAAGSATGAEATLDATTGLMGMGAIPESAIATQLTAGELLGAGVVGGATAGGAASLLGIDAISPTSAMGAPLTPTELATSSGTSAVAGASASTLGAKGLLETIGITGGAADSLIGAATDWVKDNGGNIIDALVDKVIPGVTGFITGSENQKLFEDAAAFFKSQVEDFDNNAPNNYITGRYTDENGNPTDPYDPNNQFYINAAKAASEYNPNNKYHRTAKQAINDPYANLYGEGTMFGDMMKYYTDMGMRQANSRGHQWGSGGSVDSVTNLLAAHVAPTASNYVTNLGNLGNNMNQVSQSYIDSLVDAGHSYNLDEDAILSTAISGIHPATGNSGYALSALGEALENQATSNVYSDTNLGGVASGGVEILTDILDDE